MTERSGDHQPAMRSPGRSKVNFSRICACTRSEPPRMPTLKPLRSASSRTGTMRSLPASRGGHGLPVSRRASDTRGAPSSKVSQSTAAACSRLPCQQLPLPKWRMWSRLAEHTPSGLRPGACCPVNNVVHGSTEALKVNRNTAQLYPGFRLQGSGRQITSQHGGSRGRSNARESSR